MDILSFLYFCKRVHGTNRMNTAITVNKIVINYLAICLTEVCKRMPKPIVHLLLHWYKTQKLRSNGQAKPLTTSRSPTGFAKVVSLAQYWLQSTMMAC